MMIEVEAKVRIFDPENFRKKIKKISRFVRKEKKIDDYYTLESGKSYPKKSLRIRKKGGVYEVNFKRRLSFVKGIHAKNEEEFVVSNIVPFVDLIENFGFRRWLRKEKATELYNVGKNFNIELNEVKNLGWFLEIEYMCDLKNLGIARKKVLEIISLLGIKNKDIISEGYTKMLWDKGKLGV